MSRTTFPTKPKKKLPPISKKVIQASPKKESNPLPLSHKRDPNANPQENKNIKPVFGVTTQSTIRQSNAGLTVRVGNTLMQAQEKKFTPPEKVVDYVTLPIYELTELPVFKKRILPQYPEELEDQELEGKAVISITVDDRGKVVKAVVKQTDHDLFAQSAIRALLASIFTPGKRNGTPVATIIDIPVKFLLEE